MESPKIRQFRSLVFSSLLLFLSVSCSNSQVLKCTRVVDGDTIILSNGERVRLIGVDTPETKHSKKPVEYYGKEASAFTKRMVEGKEVRLEYDQQQRDKYGRLLAYVYLMDGTFLNAEIIKQGYGNAYIKFPFKYMDDFRQYEKEARETKRGLWAGEPAGEWNKDEREILTDLVDYLTPLEHKLVVAHAIEDKSFRKIAKELRKSPSTISKLYKGAITKLQQWQRQ